MSNMSTETLNSYTKNLNRVLFFDTYERLSRTGVCDSAGGMEYHRVRDEWEAAGCPEEVADFIKVAANRSSDEALAAASKLGHEKLSGERLAVIQAAVYELPAPMTVDNMLGCVDAGEAPTLATLLAIVPPIERRRYLLGFLHSASGDALGWQDRSIMHHPDGKWELVQSREYLLRHVAGEICHPEESAYLRSEFQRHGVAYSARVEDGEVLVELRRATNVPS